jgi:hypothetical protein
LICGFENSIKIRFEKHRWLDFDIQSPEARVDKGFNREKPFGKLRTGNEKSSFERPPLFSNENKPRG